MKRKLSESFGVLALLGAAILLGGGCTPTDRDFASGGGGGAGGAGGCPAGFVECDGNPDTVCETDTSTNLAHCGMCNNACAAAVDANIECVAGKCSITSCNNGRGNCDNFYDNGCETSPSTSFEHCGTCGNSCEAPDAITACVASSCQLAQCVAGKLDCDKDPKTGCEVDPTSNVDHCSACGMACTTPNGTMECLASTCSFVACNTNFDDCNGLKADGCEVDLMTNPYNCGACKVQCGGGACNAGVCNPPILVAKASFPAGKMTIFKGELFFGSRSTMGEIGRVSVTGGTPTIIGTSPGFTNAIATNGKTVFIAASAGALRVDFDGTNKYTYGSQASRGIDASTSTVYWSTLTSIRSAPAIGANSTTFWSGLDQAIGVTLAGTSTLYWTTTDGSVWSSPTSPSGGKPIAMGPSGAGDIVADTKNLYWASTKGLHRAPLDGGNTTNLVVTSVTARSIAVDDNYVYWTDEGKGLVQRVPTIATDSMPETLALDQMKPFGLAVDSQFVYWTNSDTGEIWKLPK